MQATQEVTSDVAGICHVIRAIRGAIQIHVYLYFYVACVAWNLALLAFRALHTLYALRKETGNYTSHSTQIALQMVHSPHISFHPWKINPPPKKKLKPNTPLDICPTTFPSLDIARTFPRETKLPGKLLRKKPGHYSLTGYSTQTFPSWKITRPPPGQFRGCSWTSNHCPWAGCYFQ